MCSENPSILLIEKFNEFDCITKSEAFANVSLNKDLLEVAIGIYGEFSVTHIELSNINYRIISYKNYVYWRDGNLG